MTITLENCIAFDAKDPLAECKDRFLIKDNLIYLDGNSLGAMPKTTMEEVSTALHNEWGEDLIQSWNTANWFELPLILGDQLGPLVGAASGQIVVSDSTSINIFKVLHAALGLNPHRTKIVADKNDFPTDLYMIEGVVKNYTRSLSVTLLDADASIADAVDEETAVVVLSQVNYKTGNLIDMERVTKQVQDAGALVIWDLCHSAGALPVSLDRCNADFAVGCTYKYLNGGPGSPAFLYAAHRHHEKMRQPLSGWWSHASPFAFSHHYDAAAGIKKMLSGTQPILSMRGIGSGIASFDGFTMDQIREKSMALCQLFIDLVTERCGGDGVEVIGPADSRNRGSHVSLRFKHGYAVVRAMIAKGVIGDFRAPDLMRFGIAPLYVSYQDMWHAVEIMKACIDEQVWMDPEFEQKRTVT